MFRFSPFKDQKLSEQEIINPDPSSFSCESVTTTEEEIKTLKYMIQPWLI